MASVTVWSFVVVTVAVPAVVPTATAATASGPSTVSNATIADKALSYAQPNQQYGGQACVDARMSGSGAPGTPGAGDNMDGECRSFVNCIIKLVTGLNIAYGNTDYQQAFRDVHAAQIAPADAIRGDVIQYGNGEGHTAIVLDNLGGGVFSVVNSNGSVHHKVTVDNLTPPATAMFWRFGQPTLSTSQVNGKLVGHPSGNNYYVVDNQRRWIPDAETLACLILDPPFWLGVMLVVSTKKAS